LEIPFENYLAEAQILSAAENKLLKQALDRLPKKIIDAHTHISNKFFSDEFVKLHYSHIISTFPKYSLIDANKLRRLLWDNKKIQSLRIPNPVFGYDHKRINEYLLSEASKYNDYVVGYGLPDDIEYTVTLLEDNNIAALKMYFRYTIPEKQKVLEVFPPEILETCQKLNIPIILHLPQSLPQSLGEVIELLKLFPKQRIIIAHLGGHGGQYFEEGLLQAYKELYKFSNIYFDTAFVFDTKIISLALDVFGHKRIIFGTDEPISLIRGVLYKHPVHGGRIYAPGYHWWKNEMDLKKDQKKNPLLFHIQQIEALLIALEKFPTIAIENVFYKNSSYIFKN
jgi:glutamate-1-semialdehyde 2,1-aminomutase